MNNQEFKDKKVIIVGYGGASTRIQRELQHLGYDVVIVESSNGISEDDNTLIIHKDDIPIQPAFQPEPIPFKMIQREVVNYDPRVFEKPKSKYHK